MSLGGISNVFQMLHFDKSHRNVSTTKWPNHNLAAKCEIALLNISKTLEQFRDLLGCHGSSQIHLKLASLVKIRILNIANPPEWLKMDLEKVVKTLIMLLPLLIQFLHHGWLAKGSPQVLENTICFVNFKQRFEVCKSFVLMKLLMISGEFVHNRVMPMIFQTPARKVCTAWKCQKQPFLDGKISP